MALRGVVTPRYVLGDLPYNFTMVPMRPRKKIRLDPNRYSDPGSVWHVSTTTLHRKPVFTDPEMATVVIDALRFQCSKARADLLLYCVMPDHVHLVVTITEIDLISILRDIKSWTTHVWMKRTGQKQLWQESFHDHGVRRSERMDDLMAYIVANPVHAGLVADWRAYPWLGGTLIDDAPST
jgi:putative transposase